MQTLYVYGNICIHYLFETRHHTEYFREGNNTPLQYSCLENPMDGGAL